MVVSIVFIIFGLLSCLKLKHKQLLKQCWSGKNPVSTHKKFWEEMTLLLTALSSRALENSELLTYLMR